MASNCDCNLVGLLSINYNGISAASINGSTTVDVSESGLVLLGATINTLSITAYPFSPGGDHFLGATCPSSASAQIQWLQKYDCVNNVVHFIPKSGGKASITGGPINGVTLTCDPGINSVSFDANASSGPATPFRESIRRDGFNLKYDGGPIPIQSGSPKPYNINLGITGNIVAYLQSFSLSVNLPAPATVQYSFVFTP